MSNLLGRVRNFYHFLCDLIAWLPIIWHDRDWDYAYLYRIMAFKLRRMQRLMETYGYHVTSERDAVDMKVCAHILERLAEGDPRIWGREHAHLELFAKIFVRKSMRWWT